MKKMTPLSFYPGCCVILVTLLMFNMAVAQQGKVLVNLHTGLPSGALYCIGSPSFGTQWGFDVGYIIQPNTVILLSYDRKLFTLDPGCFYGDFAEELQKDNGPYSIRFEPERTIPERFFSLSVRQRLFDTLQVVALYGLLGLTMSDVPARTVIVSSATREFRWSANSFLRPGIVYGVGLDFLLFRHLSLFFDFRWYDIFEEVEGYNSLDVFNSTIGVGVAL